MKSGKYKFGTGEHGFPSNYCNGDEVECFVIFDGLYASLIAFKDDDKIWPSIQIAKKIDGFYRKTLAHRLDCKNQKQLIKFLSKLD